VAPIFVGLVGKECEVVLICDMTLKQQIHDLVDELPDDSPLLIEVREALRMNQAIGEAIENVRDGRTFGGGFHGESARAMSA
jgi:hypothetical protein